MDRIAFSLAVWVALAALAWLDAHTFATGPVLTAGWFTIGAAIVNAITSLFRLFGGSVLRAVKVALEGIRIGVKFLGDGFLAFMKISARAFWKVWYFFVNLAKQVIWPAIQALIAGGKWVYRILQRIFQPVLNLLLEVRKRLLQFYDDYVKPVLDVIDYTREVLRILGDFGVEWARKLDEALDKVETEIRRRFTETLGYINNLIDRVDKILTLDGLFQRITFLRTHERDVKFIWRILNNSQSEPVSAADVDAYKKRGKPKPMEEAQREVGEFLRTGGGPRAAVINEMIANMRIQLFKS